MIEALFAACAVIVMVAVLDALARKFVIDLGE